MARASGRRKPPYLVRLLRAHARLFGSALVALVAFVALAGDWALPTRLLLAWDIGIALYLLLIYQLMGGTDVGDIRERADAEDEGRAGILVAGVVSALASLGATVVLLGNAPAAGADAVHGQRLLLALVTIFLSWTFTHTIFAVHYAHEFYRDDGGRGGLAFPSDDAPDYWDFCYFSFVIGMTSQVSDVQITGKPLRRIATVHGVLSFIFNTAVLALTINIAAGTI